MSNSFKFRMRFVLWIYEMLNLSHRELSNSNKSGSWSNLVSESQSNLSSSKRKPSSIVIKKFIEIQKHSLSSFRSKISDWASTGPNWSFEHQIKGLSRSQVISSLSSFYFIIFDNLVNLSAIHGVNVGCYVLKFS